MKKPLTNSIYFTIIFIFTKQTASRNCRWCTREPNWLWSKKRNWPKFSKSASWKNWLKNGYTPNSCANQLSVNWRIVFPTGYTKFCGGPNKENIQIKRKPKSLEISTTTRIENLHLKKLFNLNVSSASPKYTPLEFTFQHLFTFTGTLGCSTE